MTRLANGPNFELKQLTGRELQELIGATDADSDERVEMLFIQLSGDVHWHRIFLDAGIGFWETMYKEDAFCDFEDLRLVDFADQWVLRGTRIISANCVSGRWNDSAISQFSLIMDAGTVHLGYANSADAESDTTIWFSPFKKAGG